MEIQSNFDFLGTSWPELEKIGDLAERYVYEDSNTCFLKLGLFSETIVEYMLAYDKIDEPKYDNTHLNRVKLLKKHDALPKEIDDILYVMRKTRNKAAHEGYESQEEALTLLRLAYKLSVWFMQTYGSSRYKPQPFSEPQNMSQDLEELARLNREQEEKIAQLQAQLRIIKQQGGDDGGRKAISYSAADGIDLSEEEVRVIIDEQLRNAGWMADSRRYRYSKGTRPSKNQAIAIAQWPTDSILSGDGYADYALFINQQLLGVIEAKKQTVDVSQTFGCHHKTDACEAHESKRWDGYQIPFLFAANGRRLSQAHPVKSGIWFFDTRSAENRPEPLTRWLTPVQIQDLLFAGKR